MADRLAISQLRFACLLVAPIALLQPDLECDGVGAGSTIDVRSALVIFAVHARNYPCPRLPQKTRSGLSSGSMIGLTDSQLKIIMTVASGVPVERRGIFLERCGAMLRMRGYGHFTDADVADVAQLALAGLVQQTADSAA